MTPTISNETGRAPEALPRFSVRDCWAGALTFGLLGPLIGGAPIIGLMAIVAAADGTAALQHLANFAGTLGLGWLVALGFGAVPGAMTGIIRATYCRRLGAGGSLLLTLAIGVTLASAYPWALDGLDHLRIHPLGSMTPQPGHGMTFGLMLMFSIPTLWAAPACEALMPRRAPLAAGNGRLPVW